jgi:hypothetical protein
VALYAPERTLGARASFRLRQLVSSGGLALEPIRCSCRPGTQGTKASPCRKQMLRFQPSRGIQIRGEPAQIFVIYDGRRVFLYFAAYWIAPNPYVQGRQEIIPVQRTHKDDGHVEENHIRALNRVRAGERFGRAHPVGKRRSERRAGSWRI